MRSASNSRTQRRYLPQPLKKARSIPFTAPVDDGQFELAQTINDEPDGRLLMQFRLTGYY